MKLTKFMCSRRIIVSAIQPTGVLHLGNYFGAVQNWCSLQREENTKLYIGIADLHAITKGFPRVSTLRDNITQMAACVLACGIDPERTAFFQQSRIPEHTELAWILAANVTTSQLQRLSQFKDKAAPYERAGNVPIGLLTYPVLQAADILIYKATHVPVGDDQTQHLEMTQIEKERKFLPLTKIARAFNKTIGQKFFPVPQSLYTSSARVRSLRDPFKKMSKSDADGRSRIELNDSDSAIGKKCRRALTDSIAGLEFDPVNRPAISNLLSLHASVLGVSPRDVVSRCHAMDKVTYKDTLASDIVQLIAPMRERYESLLANPQQIDEILDRGAEEARAAATKCLRDVKRKCGFTRVH